MRIFPGMGFATSEDKACKFTLQQAFPSLSVSNRPKLVFIWNRTHTVCSPAYSPLHRAPANLGTTHCATAIITQPVQHLGRCKPCKTLEKTPEDFCILYHTLPCLSTAAPHSPWKATDTSGRGSRGGSVAGLAADSAVLAQLCHRAPGAGREVLGGRERTGFGPSVQGTRLAGGQCAAETGSAVGSRECLCTPTLGAVSPAGTGRAAAVPPCSTGHQHWQGPAFACQKGFEGGPSEPGKRGYFFPKTDIAFCHKHSSLLGPCIRQGGNVTCWTFTQPPSRYFMSQNCHPPQLSLFVPIRDHVHPSTPCFSGAG
ncbi:uncharacterized protein LOC141954450 [Strix uralensis]|uniref:uncharacterized protein LOC141954450 n=1 Tax=Strix uralensis TaxID=36305 RepID=UPI003DA73A23